MSNMVKNRIFIKLTVILLFLSACAKDFVEPAPPGGGEEIPVMLKLKVPSTSTKGMTDAQEQNVQFVDVLAFDSNNRLTDWQQGQISSSAGGVLSFEVPLKASVNSSDKYRLVVLANVRVMCFALFEGANLNGHVNDSYANIMALLEDALPAQISDVIARGGLPMWGETKDNIIIDNTHRNPDAIFLHRAIARIDVGTHPGTVSVDANNRVMSYEPLDNFSLEEVYVFRGNTHFRVGSSYYDFADKKVTDITLPTGAGNTAKLDSVVYDDNALITRYSGLGISMLGAMYAAEANVGMTPGATYGDANHMNRMGIVVGGRYSSNGTVTGSEPISYYRIDFYDNGQFHNILRNNCYQVVIKSVNSPGSGTPSIAWKKMNVDITANIIDWTNAGQGATVVDDNNWLSVDRYDIELSRWATLNPELIKVATNVAAGWTAVVKSGSPWLELTTASGNSGQNLGFNFISVFSGPGRYRDGVITVTAGKMNLDIRVRQSYDVDDFMLSLSTSELIIPGRQWDAAASAWGAPDPRSIDVIWSPPVYDYDMNLTPYVAGGVVGPDLPGTGTNLSSYQPSVEVALSAISATDTRVIDDPFFERSSRLGFTAHNTSHTSTITKQVLIRQVFYSILVTDTCDYYLQGKDYSLTVRSNTSWITTIDDPESILENITGTSGNGSIANVGEKFNFSIKSDATVDKIARVTFHNADNLFPPRTVVICAQDELPNCYLAPAGSGYVDIPVRKAYRVWKWDKDLKGFNPNGDLPSGTATATLLWRDNSALTLGITLTGTGRDAVIRVTFPSGVSGNAVVCYRINSVVYWSWHIWVTSGTVAGANINGITVMNRYLGAHSTTAGNTGTIGLLYQGGRKDPFPGPVGFANPNLIQKPLYTALTGNTAVSNVILYNSPATTDRLRHAIVNPTTVYVGNYGNTHWYTPLPDIGNELRTHFWKEDEKTDFDPCPSGWRVVSFDKIIIDLEYTTMPGGIATVADGWTWRGHYFPNQGQITYATQNFTLSRNALSFYSSRLSDGVKWTNKNGNGPTTDGTRLANRGPVRCMADN